MTSWGSNTAGIGAVLAVFGALAVSYNEGAIGLRHPFELSGMLGRDRRRATMSHVMMLAGFALSAIGLAAVTLGGVGW